MWVQLSQIISCLSLSWLLKIYNGLLGFRQLVIAKWRVLLWDKTRHGGRFPRAAWYWVRVEILITKIRATITLQELWTCSGLLFHWGLRWTIRDSLWDYIGIVMWWQASFRLIFLLQYIPLVYFFCPSSQVPKPLPLLVPISVRLLVYHSILLPCRKV